MEFLFRIKDFSKSPLPADGDLHLIPRQAGHQGRRDLSQLALEQGPAAFVQGAGTPARLILQADPTLDDMLAAAIVARQLDGKTVPEGMGVMARYAALAREGLKPGDIPLESSIEGIYLAIRNGAGEDLTDPADGARFSAAWERMALVLWEAALQGKDPFTEPLFDQGHEFAREKTFLRNDRDVYLQDVLRGERWLVRLPGGPPTSSALVLRQPKSLLFKYWSRQDADAPEGGAYLFLGVVFGTSQWIFSTDPVQRLDIKELASRLQSLEQGKDPDRASADPWFDGAAFGHTLVASPRAGTILAEAEVLQCVRKWFNARLVHLHESNLLRPALYGATALLMVCAAVLTWTLFVRPPKPRTLDFTNRGEALSIAKVQDLKSEGIHLPGYALIVGVSDPQDQFPPLSGACSGAIKVYCLLRDYYGMDPKNMRLMVDRAEEAKDDHDRPIPVAAVPTLENVTKEIRELGEETMRYPEGDRTNFVFYYGGHGYREKLANDIGHLVLSGFDRKRPDTTGFEMSRLSKFIQDRIKSSHQILLMDSCFSGFAVVPRGPADDPTPSRIYELWKKHAHVVLTASSREERSWEVDGKSIFTEMLCNALGEGHLADQDKDGIITDAELGQYLSTNVPKTAEWISQKRFTLNPQYWRGLQGDDVGQFLFISRKP